MGAHATSRFYKVISLLLGTGVIFLPNEVVVCHLVSQVSTAWESSEEGCSC